MKFKKRANPLEKIVSKLMLNERDADGGKSPALSARREKRLLTQMSISVDDSEIK